MNILDCLVKAPTKAEGEARPVIDQIWSIFDFFYETGDPQNIESKNGNNIGFSNNRKARAWNLIINHKLILTSDDANELVTTAAKYF